MLSFYQFVKLVFKNALLKDSQIQHSPSASLYKKAENFNYFSFHSSCFAWTKSQDKYCCIVNLLQIGSENVIKKKREVGCFGFSLAVIASVSSLENAE